MRVAIDTGPLTSGHKVRGIGFYTKDLINALGNKVDTVNFGTADLGKYDIIHYPYFDLFSHTLPIKKPAKTVVTVHDVIPLIYSDHYPPGICGKINFYLQKYSLRNVDAIITDTETSKKDIVRFLGVKPEKIYVIHLAPRNIFRKMSSKARSGSAREIAKRYKLPDRFALYVGDVNYNKNIPNLVSACRIAKISLVIVGKQAKEIGKQDLDHPELLHLKGADFSKVMRLGFVPDEDLVAIYNLAAVYVQPSLYEGFGLPVLEALACGRPVIAARTQSLVEIAEGAVTFVNPKDPEDIARGFKNLVKSPKLPRRYSWGKTARDTFQVYAQV